MITRRKVIATGTSALAGVGLAPLLSGTAFAQAKGSISLIVPQANVVGLKPFEQKSGIEVKAGSYISTTDSLAKLTNPGSGGRYDMLTLNQDVGRIVLGPGPGKELALPMDVTKVPNLKYVPPAFHKYMTQRDGKIFVVPYYFGYESVIYNRDVVPENDPDINSWALLFSDRYKGRVALRDDAHAGINVAALAMGHKHPIVLDRAQLAEVTKFLISKKANIRALWTKFAEAVALMASKEVAAMFGWISMRSKLQAEGHNVTNNWPKEGILIWINAAVIPRTAANPAAAYDFVNYLLSPDFGMLLADVSGGYPTVSTLVRDKLSPQRQAEIGFDLLDRADRNPYVFPVPDNLDEWLEAWARFKAA